MKYDWSKENIELIIKDATCIKHALQLLNVPYKGRNFSTLKRKLLQYGIDTSHFDKNARNHVGKHSIRLLKNRENNEIFYYGSKTKREHLKREYISRILKENKCECCGITEWNSLPIVLQLHHKDGNPLNNVVENLQLLCPNCHSQTDTFCNRTR